MLVASAIVGAPLGDYVWAQGLLLTSPLVATLGTTLNIPSAMISDSIVHSARYGASYVGGAVCVVAGFVLVNISTTPSATEPTDAAAAAANSDADVKAVVVKSAMSDAVVIPASIAAAADGSGAAGAERARSAATSPLLRGVNGGDAAPSINA